MTNFKQTLQQGYEKFVVKNPEGCWGWSGCQPKNPGYGQFRYSLKKERAHRASWIIHFGEIPKGKSVLHKCDNRICSNPEHLFLGTQAENIKDMVNKKRLSKYRGKLVIDDVKQIKQLLRQKYRGIDIAKMFNITKPQVSCIKLEKAWKEVF